MSAEVVHESSEQIACGKTLTKQEEILIKRLIFQNNLQLDSDKAVVAVDGLSEAEFNRLSWEVALIAMHYADEEWDDIMIALDDPTFDWALAKLPEDISSQIKAGSSHARACELVSSEVALGLADNEHRSK